MVRRSLAEATEAMRGRLVTGEGSRIFDGAALDSRKVRPGQLFFALVGERTDGHRFVADAGRRGAAAAVIHRDVDPDRRPAERAPVTPDPPSLGLIRVDDTYNALHDLTRHVRQQVPEHLVAITGSVGKTTTKELLAVLLARRFRVARNPGNLNNLFGFPLALLGIPDDTEWMVAEMGMSTPGELGRVSRLGRPDVAVFTNVRPVHLEFFDSVRAIAEAKAELLEGLREGGLVVVNAADPELVRIARRHRERHPQARVVGYRVDSDPAEPEEESVPAHGLEPDYRVTGLEPFPAREGVGDSRGPGHRFRLVTPRGTVPVELPLHGIHNVENFLAAAATAIELGVPLEDLAAAARGLVPAAGRGEVHRLPGEITILDDSYNSNPAALSRALEGAQALPARRRWAVLGDMLELGSKGPEFHRAAGREAVDRGFDPVCGVGELARELVRAAAETTETGEPVETPWFATAAEAADWAATELSDGDLVLVKGSRGVGLEAVVRRLLESWGTTPERRASSEPGSAGTEEGV